VTTDTYNTTRNTVNDVQYADNKNVKVVDDFLKQDFIVSANEWDYVLSFFKKAMKDPAAAKNFTISIYQVSRQANVPVLDLVKTLNGQTGLEMTASLAYYMNGIRSSTTLLGVEALQNANYYAARNVLI
jgi:hypothetical protein